MIEHPAGAAGAGGIGTIHPNAWREPGDEEQHDMQERLTHGGISVPPVRDRPCFGSLYYPEHGGVLFEIATGVPSLAWTKSRSRSARR